MLHGTYDVIVIGLGGMGSAAASELARRGQRVLGLEQFSLGHDRGSSHGRTRVIRKAYFEHPDYVPLLHRAFQRWYDLEQRHGRHLLTECACLSIGRADGPLLTGIRRAAAEHRLRVDALSADELTRQFPVFRVGADVSAVLEHEAGFLRVEDCVLLHNEDAQLHGADLREGTPVRAWSADGTGVVVETDRHRYGAQKLIITAGPWAAQLLAELRLPLTVMRQVQLWFGVSQPARFRRDAFPIYIAEQIGSGPNSSGPNSSGPKSSGPNSSGPNSSGPNGSGPNSSGPNSSGPNGSPQIAYHYGLPVINELGHKCSRHYGGAETASVAELDRTVRPDDEADVRAFLSAHLPSVDGPLRRGVVCPYTMTPDRHFLIDRHPAHASVLFAAGFSGHGFKFASVVGEILADLAISGRTALPVELFRLARLAALPKSAKP